MKKHICAILLVLHLTACNNVGNPTDTTSKTAAKTETTTTTTTTAITTTETTTTTVTTTEIPTETTISTEWSRREWVFNPVCHIDTVVYASPSTEAEQLGLIPAGSTVNDISRVNDTSNWIVIDWNGGVGFIEANEVYEDPVNTTLGDWEINTTYDPTADTYTNDTEIYTTGIEG